MAAMDSTTDMVNRTIMGGVLPLPDRKPPAPRETIRSPGMAGSRQYFAGRTAQDDAAIAASEAKGRDAAGLPQPLYKPPPPAPRLVVATSKRPQPSAEDLNREELARVRARAAARQPIGMRMTEGFA